jgi:hypothetical protein
MSEYLSMYWKHWTRENMQIKADNNKQNHVNITCKEVIENK